MPLVGFLRKALLTLGVFVLSGCYTYVPIAEVSPGTRVRAQLPVETRRADGTVETESVPVDGEVVAFGDSLVLATRTRQQIGNFREVTVEDTLRVARANLSGVEERVFSRSRTVGMTALALAGAVGLILGIGGAVGGDSGNGNGGGGPVVNLVSGPFVEIFRTLVGAR